MLPNWLLSRRSNTLKQEQASIQSLHSNAPDESAQRDRARIIHCAAFRRLQSKTQIHNPNENDFYRTRLTHSLEVAQIGSGICERLRYHKDTDEAFKLFIASPSQMEAICLAHDIGHPPFGHGGEVALNFYMYQHGGFEGNGQTLRIVSKLGEYSNGYGLNVTRRTMLGLLKYPVLHKNIQAYPQIEHDEKKLNHYRPPKCLHDDESDSLTWVLQPLSQADQDIFTQLTKNKSKYKSFDTSIMELADDIAYGVHDLEDALSFNLVTERQWQEEVIPKLIGTKFFSIFKPDDFNQKLFSPSNQERKLIISKIVSYFIQNISIQSQHTFQTPLLDLQAIMSEEAENNLAVLKDFVFRYVIKTQEVKMLEYKGQQIILKLFEVLLNDPEKLLPSSTYQKIKKDEKHSHRIICDYIAGMTDNYAIKFYQKLL